MKVWLFDIMQWPYRQSEIPYPMPGYMWDRQLGKELYDGHLALYKRPTSWDTTASASRSITTAPTASIRRPT